MSTASSTSPAAKASSAPLLPKVGLIGPANAGKTTYFAVLDRALRDRDWKVEVYGDDPKDAERGSLINKIRRDLYKGAFPRTTKVGDKVEQLIFHISKGTRSGKKGRFNVDELDLAFYDPPGELFEPSPSQDQYNTSRERLFKHMKDCVGLLVLLDIRRPATELEEAWRLSIESFMGYIRRNNLTHLLENNSLKARTAVLFTKADLLPWFQLHRQRDADWWVERHEGLKSLVSDMRRMCHKVRLFFCSAVGWNQGRPNCRVAILPKRMSVEDTLKTLGHEVEQGDTITRSARRQEVEHGDLIPDLALARVGNNESGGIWLRRPTLPLFVDPMQIVNEEEVDRQVHTVQSGLLDMPGRKAQTSAQEKFLSPWNIVQPLEWAAGVPESEY